MGNACLVAQFCHVVGCIVSILIKRTFFISYTHQAVKEIIIQIIGFTCHMVHNPAKISLFIIGISIQLLLCSAGRFSEIAFCHPVLTVVGVPDLISICINSPAEISVSTFINILYHLAACNGCGCCVSKGIIFKSISEAVVVNGRQFVLCIAISIFYHLLCSVCSYFLRDGSHSVSRIIFITQPVALSVCQRIKKI